MEPVILLLDFAKSLVDLAKAVLEFRFEGKGAHLRKK
jgi:hypothetical protein